MADFRWDAARVGVALARFDGVAALLKGEALAAAAENARAVRDGCLRDEVLMGARLAGAHCGDGGEGSAAAAFAVVAHDAILRGESAGALTEEVLFGWQKGVAAWKGLVGTEPSSWWLPGERLFGVEECDEAAMVGVGGDGGWRRGGARLYLPGSADGEGAVAEGVAAELVAGEMARFLAWFNGAGRELHPVLAAGVAHAWFENIHPFSDGNGRVGRALIDVALGRLGLGEARVFQLSCAIHADVGNYYRGLRELGDCSHGMDATVWLEWFVGVAGDSVNRSRLQLTGEVCA